MTNLVELEPKFENVKSYYRKAYVRYYDNGDSALVSYDTLVADIKTMCHVYTWFTVAQP